MADVIHSVGRNFEPKLFAPLCEWLGMEKTHTTFLLLAISETGTLTSHGLQICGRGLCAPLLCLCWDMSSGVYKAIAGSNGNRPCVC